jgi:hypothetical protein
MWVRWALAIVVAVSVMAAIVIAISSAGPESTTSEAGAEAEINRLSDIAITEDQAPHSASLARGSAPASALEQAIARDVSRRVASGQLTGPLKGVTCAPAGAGSAGRDPYRCTVHSAGIAYPFVAVVDAPKLQLIWCKIDPPPVSGVGPEIPLSASCRA